MVFFLSNPKIVVLSLSVGIGLESTKTAHLRPRSSGTIAVVALSCWLLTDQTQVFSEASFSGDHLRQPI